MQAAPYRSTRGTAGIRQRHSRTCTKPKSGCACSWEAFAWSPKDGRKIRKTFPTRAAAKAWREDAKPAVRRNELRAPSPVTLAEAWEAWFADAKAGVVRPRSREPYKPNALRSYERSMRLRVLPALGHKRLCDLERYELQRLIDRWVAEGMTAALLDVSFSPLRSILRRAMQDPHSGVTVNPAAGLEFPARAKGRDRVADPVEAAALLAALEHDRALWATALYAGLRRGELQALRVEDIDLAAGIIHVRGNWDQCEGPITPKSGKGRKVPITAALRRYLAEHLLALEWSDGLVFGRTPSEAFQPASVRNRADSAWEAAKLDRITLHECRHTFASLMIAAGVGPKHLQAYLGHATITMTMDRYGHLFPGNEDEAAGLLDAYLTRSESGRQVS